jgi:hypothetical protein
MADQFALPKGKDRGLTPGEAELARSIFGDSVDYSQIRIHRSKIPGLIESRFQPDNVAVPADGKNIYMPDGIYKDDLSKSDPANFIHLMAYIWQFQDHVTTPDAAKKWAIDNRNNIDAVTKTVIDPHKDLKDYNIEQRAQLLTDLYYYRQELANPQKPATDADRAAALEKIGGLLKAQPTDQNKKLALGWFGIELGPDGQPRYNEARVREMQENAKKNAAEQQQENRDLLQVLSRFIANPSYLDPTKPTSGPASPPAPPAGKSPAPAAKAPASQS